MADEKQGAGRDEERDPTDEIEVEDLDVEDADSENVKGGVRKAGKEQLEY